jgi:hypothetical protein
MKVVTILLAFLLSSCLVVGDSPAPGCVESVGLPIAGGCFGKTVILDLTMTPEPACLSITVNNCNGGVLEVDNACQETLMLAGVEIPPSHNVSLDIVKENGKYTLYEVPGNFSSYVPEANTGLTITGKLGNRDVTITFTKTAPLCE